MVKKEYQGCPLLLKKTISQMKKKNGRERDYRRQRNWRIQMMTAAALNRNLPPVNSTFSTNTASITTSATTIQTIV